MSYRTIKIPKPLADRIDQVTKRANNKEGFRSRAEFVNAAIRDMLWRLKQIEQEEVKA